MDKSKNASAWTEQGYALYAEEGLEGIQVERLARMLHLNKSGFYHYFGDMEVYREELLRLHDDKINHFLEEVGQIKCIDPEYLLLLMKYPNMVMFQIQLTREKDNLIFYHASEAVDRRVNHVVRKLWGEFLDIQGNSDLAQRCHFVLRDMFYTRASFKNLNYEYLHNFVEDVKQVVTQLKRQQLLSDNLLR